MIAFAGIGAHAFRFLLRNAPETTSSITHHEEEPSPVPHPFRFFLRKEWEATNLIPSAFRCEPGGVARHAAMPHNSDPDVGIPMLTVVETSAFAHRIKS